MFCEWIIRSAFPAIPFWLGHSLTLVQTELMADALLFVCSRMKGWLCGEVSNFSIFLVTRILPKWLLWNPSVLSRKFKTWQLVSFPACAQDKAGGEEPWRAAWIKEPWRTAWIKEGTMQDCMDKMFCLLVLEGFSLLSEWYLGKIFVVLLRSHTFLGTVAQRQTSQIIDWRANAHQCEVR